MSNYPESILPSADPHHSVLGEIGEAAFRAWFGYELIWGPRKYLTRLALANVLSGFIIFSICFAGYDAMTGYLIAAHSIVYIWAIPNKLRLANSVPAWAVKILAVLLVGVPLAVVFYLALNS